MKKAFLYRKAFFKVNLQGINNIMRYYFFSLNRSKIIFGTILTIFFYLFEITGVLRAEEVCSLQDGSSELPAVCIQSKVVALDKILQDKNNQVEQLVGKVYGVNKGSSEYGADYVQELLTFQNKANRAWKEYRDSTCYAESYIDGMSRREISNIAEDCRLLMTEKKISEINHKISNLQ